MQILPTLGYLEPQGLGVPISAVGEYSSFWYVDLWDVVQIQAHAMLTPMAGHCSVPLQYILCDRMSQSTQCLRRLVPNT